MLLGFTAVAVATCFCLGSTPIPEGVPIAPDALTTHIVAPADAIPERCLTGSRAWAHTLTVCPLMPVQAEQSKPSALRRAF